MEIISICNQKGGTGKTTTTINLGVALAKLNKKVLLIDLDSQASLTFSFGINNQAGTISEVLQGKQTIQNTFVEKENITIAPSSIQLADVELAIIGKKIGRELILKEKLKELKNFDYVFIDCPPSLSILTINAFNISDKVLIPAQMEVLSLQGLSLLLDTIKEVKQILNKKIKVAGIIATLYNSSRNLSEEVSQEIEKKLKEKIFNTKIRVCVKLAEAPSFAKSVLAYAPGSNGAIDYINLAKEFIKDNKTKL
ncbi:MAG: ParA family protein [Enterobacteriaceae bacterium]|nr:ParA family protein [Enterobacteriaceae bacterium]